ncbi:conserved protein of unknown function [Rhodovastum atsumiense]|uniref:Protein phosphatase 2C domain-containing protein n=1 Tax=Rhodovastum atsumiense TaxID=504468 RepID=A0A5M6J183_9PROT|nr:hypothetical protein [Rhodovastum atsumiense]KAA5613388.1 hypothetical protein F1189_04825 [Rhodovastum atsumiense]CAH2603076.1 conserved protein of unknown function [Rhodovastum atsumiense]
MSGAAASKPDPAPPAPRCRVFRTRKDSLCPSEDAVCLHRGLRRYALGDGASTSYAARGWARALCRQFVLDPTPGPDWLEAARRYFHARNTPDPADWSAWHAFHQGSYATFLGFHFTGEGLVVEAIGDTVLFVMGPEGEMAMHPRLDPEDFAGAPVLPCSHAGHGAFPDTADAFATGRRLLPPPAEGWAGTRLLAVTDALAAWVAAGEGAARAERLGRLAGLPDAAGFAALVAEETAAGRLARDDCTLLALQPQ